MGRRSNISVTITCEQIIPQNISLFNASIDHDVIEEDGKTLRVKDVTISRDDYSLFLTINEEESDPKRSKMFSWGLRSVDETKGKSFHDNCKLSFLLFQVSRFKAFHKILICKLYQAGFILMYDSPEVLLKLFNCKFGSLRCIETSYQLAL